MKRVDEWENEPSLLEKLRKQIDIDEKAQPPRKKITNVDELPIIYLDIDGVLADFQRSVNVAFRKKLGRLPKWLPNGMVADNDDKILIEVIKGTKRFWENLEWTNNGKKLFKFVEKYRPHILSAYMKVDGRSPAGKRVWLRKNIGMNKLGAINIVRRIEKSLFAVNLKTGRPNILIDDLDKNIDRFEQAGGIGLLYSDKNHRKTIRDLRQIGFI